MTITREEALRRAVLYVLQLSDKDVKALMPEALIRALEQDGYTILATPDAPADVDWFTHEVVAYFKLYDHHDIWCESGARRLGEWLKVRRATPDAPADGLPPPSEHDEKEWWRPTDGACAYECPYTEEGHAAHDVDHDFTPDAPADGQP